MPGEGHVLNSIRPYLGHAVCFAIVGYITWTAYQGLFGGVSKIPGPWLARFTRFWLFSETRKGGFEKANIDLHKKYGPLVRISPSTISINDPAALKTIYSSGSRFPKSDFYHPFGDHRNDQRNLFSVQDNQRHALMRRKHFIDRCNTLLCDRLDRFAKDKQTFDVPTWMQYYAFDVIGDITTSQPFGLLDKGYDSWGVLESIDNTMKYGSRIGIFPELHRWIALVTAMAGMKSPLESINAYIGHQIKTRSGDSNEESTPRSDFLTRLLALRKADKIEPFDLFITVGANIAAGSDTTAISLSSVIYSLLKNPRAARKLRDEIDSFARDGKLSDQVTFEQARNMPYLQACIKEALRVHPATGRPLVRDVPPEGVTLAGKFLPGGTSVGVNSWVIHYNEEVFGPDAAEFKPERWLENDKDKLSFMEQNFIPFGSGARTCIGKNISLLEMSKVIPQLYRKYEFELAPGEKRTTWEAWFVKPKFQCYVKQREDI
ncbi:cytochrome protein [Aspergillus steynii IBT 23096]|uniref:Cytochrome protein n=1 Tax=Aspergillus steynii IBT 23096 TaxID=1392250 RepID=A0A2I2GHZ7_9EURO|nr:cytochrome protein [Aspergillus steynii IBT 23096]PLB52502.1 cytochrome protein [Aspergillus steynii IBT 23096]